MNYSNFRRLSLPIKKYYFSNQLSNFSSSTLNLQTNKHKIYSTLVIPKESLDLFNNDEFRVKINTKLFVDRKTFLEEVKDCDAILVSPYDKIDKELLDSAGKKLKFISTFSVGYEHINLEECFSRNIRVTTCPYMDSGAMAEFTIGMMLNISRNITKAINTVKGVDWTSLRKDLYWLSGVGLKDSVVGIFGLGSIGMSVAKRLVGFEVKKILYHNRKRNLEGDKLGYEYVSFDDLLKESDFILCSCSINKQSEKIFDKKAFGKMKPNAIFINVSRGLAVNQDDLYEALVNHKILGAGLDVTTPQPLDPNNKLYTLSNCFITPHLAWSQTTTTNQRILISAQNIVNFFQGKKLINELTKLD